MLDHDFYAEGVRREAMDLARDSGEPQATKMIYVLSEAPPDTITDLALRRGFFVYLPIYREGESLGSVGVRSGGSSLDRS
jgi:CHASE1-domain containing sensor protein